MKLWRLNKVGASSASIPASEAGHRCGKEFASSSQAWPSGTPLLGVGVYRDQRLTWDVLLQWFYFFEPFLTELEAHVWLDYLTNDVQGSTCFTPLCWVMDPGCPAGNITWVLTVVN